MFESISGNGEEKKFTVHERLSGLGDLVTIRDYNRYIAERTEQLNALVAEFKNWEKTTYFPQQKKLDDLNDRIKKLELKKLDAERDEERKIWAADLKASTDDALKAGKVYVVERKKHEIDLYELNEMKRVFIGTVFSTLQFERQSYEGRIMDLSRPVPAGQFRAMAEESTAYRFRHGMVTGEKLIEAKIINASE